MNGMILRRSQLQGVPDSIAFCAIEWGSDATCDPFLLSSESRKLAVQGAL
jgi:hypothetical protein